MYLKGHELTFIMYLFIFLLFLWGPLMMYQDLHINKNNNLEVIVYFLSWFNPLIRTLCLSCGNAHCYDWLIAVNVHQTKFFRDGRCCI